MNKLAKVSIAVLLLLLAFSCKEPKVEQLINPDEVSAWCIKGFDIMDRTPEQRIAMVKEMGIKRYGYNRGKGDISQMIDEFKLAKENGIEIPSVFMWLNPKRDSIGKLSDGNQELLAKLAKVDQKPSIWVSFSNSFFEDITDSESMNLAVDMIKYLKSETDKIGCSLALYNHTGWFGEPDNQIEILKQVDEEELSLVLNFHHAHDYVDRFCEVAKKVKPYLSYVNLNGMVQDSSKIFTLGKGESEFDMIKCLKAEGYDGPWGILGHIKTEDVQLVLQRNMDGLDELNARYRSEQTRDK